jgi:hypothetical protein
MGILSGQQFQKLWEALKDAFPTVNDLTMMLQFRLGKSLAQIAAPNASYEYMIFEAIRHVESNDETLELINAARDSKPKNAKLLAIAGEFGLASIAPELERMVTEGLPIINPVLWRTRLGELEGRVCRIDIPGTGDGVGTGFLVGPDLVLTNHHVFQDVFDNRYRPGDVVLRFDYRRSADGKTLNFGTEFRLAPQWLVDSSPPSAVDRLADPGNQLPGPEELDYALVRVAGDPGNTPVHPDTAEVGIPPRPRGWESVPAAARPPAADSPLFIMQHPKGWPLKLAVEPLKSVLSENANRTRVRYRTNTLRGSSGSPCFDYDFTLVALHHSGNPGAQARWNEGIPIDVVAALLEKRGFGQLLTQPAPAGA